MKNYNLLGLVLITNLLVVSVVIPYISHTLSVWQLSDYFISNLVTTSLVCNFCIHTIEFYTLRKRFTIAFWKMFIVTFCLYFIIWIIAAILTGKHDFFILEGSLCFTSVFGMCCGLKNQLRSKLISVISFLLLVYASDAMFIPLVTQYNLYKTFDGVVKKDCDYSKVKFLNERKEQVSLDESQFYIVDFFNNTCATCFEKFPKLQKYGEKRKDLHIYIINVISSEMDIERSVKLLKSHDVQLKCLYMDANDSKIFDIKWFPKVVALQDNKILFEGDIEIYQLFN